MPSEQGSTRTIPAISAAALVFAIAGMLYVGVDAIKRTIGDAFATEHAISDAQRYAALAVGAQLNAETGIHGYVISGRKVFLAPFYDASRAIDRTLEALSESLARADLPDERRFVVEARTINHIWRAGVARPLLSDRHRKDAQILQVRGKVLGDRYRAAIVHIDRAVAARATAETTAAALAVSRVGLLGVLGVLLVCLVIALSLRQQSRLGRELIVERRATRAMQRGLLQESLPRPKTLALDASYVPAGREALIGGDWYDVYVLQDGRVMFSIGDVAGHGIEAAIVMSRVREAVIALGMHSDDPATVLTRANDVLLMQKSKMATAIFGYVEPSSRTVTYASAGHPPPLLVDEAGAAAFLPFSGLPLGLLNEQHYVNHRVVATRGSVFFLYTDGFTERTHDVLVGERALLEAAPVIVAAGTDRLAARMHRRIFGETAPRDDAAMLTIAFVGRVSADVDARDERIEPREKFALSEPIEATL